MNNIALSPALPMTVPATIPGLLVSGVLVIQYREEYRVNAVLENTALCARGWRISTFPKTELFLDLRDRLTRAQVYWWILDHPRMTADRAEALAGLLELCAAGSDLTVEQQRELQAAVLQLAGVGPDPYPQALAREVQARKAAGPIRLDPLGEVR